MNKKRTSVLKIKTKLERKLEERQISFWNILLTWVFCDRVEEAERMTRKLHVNIYFYTIYENIDEVLGKRW